MKRVVVISWKDKNGSTFEVFSNLKLLSESYPDFNYSTLNNYLSKSKMPYENDKVRIERKVVHTSAIPQRKMLIVGRRVDRKTHKEEEVDKKYWLSRPIDERLDAVTQLRSQFIKKGQRMNKTIGLKRKFQ